MNNPFLKEPSIDDRLEWWMAWGFSLLTERERHIVKMRTGLCGYEPQTLRDIAKRFGTTGERIRQQFIKAIRIMRNMTERNKDLFPSEVFFGEKEPITIGRDSSINPPVPPPEGQKWISYEEVEKRRTAHRKAQEAKRLKQTYHWTHPGRDGQRLSKSMITTTTRSSVLLPKTFSDSNGRFALRPKAVYPRVVSAILRNGFVKVAVGTYVFYKGHYEITVKTLSCGMSNDSTEFWIQRIIR